MLIEVKIADSYNKYLTLEKYNVLKEFVPDINYKTEWSTYEIDSSLRKELYKKNNEHDENLTDEIVSKWFNELDSEVRNQLCNLYNESKSEPKFVYPDTFIVDMELWNEKWVWAYSVIRTVKVTRKLVDNGQVIDNLTSILKVMEDKLETMQAISKNLSNTTFNQKCNVHVGGGLLAQINRVKLLEDSCSDVLQQELNIGWRIISVNVQSDQRRPDYILGRYDPAYEYNKDQAERI